MKTILVVEDDESIALALAVRLRASGYIAHTALDGDAAIKEAEKMQPDMVILDVSMQGTTGFEIVQKMKEISSLQRTPFVFITASKRPELKARAERAGAIGFFEKPLTTNELLALISFTLGSGPLLGMASA